MQNRLGDNLRKHRTAAGLSLRDLGAAASVPFASIWRLEKGYTDNPQLDTVQRLANALGVSLDALVHSGEVIE